MDTVGKSSGRKEVKASGSAKSRAHLHTHLRKTKICAFHLRAACQFGDECAFAHTSTELQPTPDLSKTQICQAFISGGCTDPNCSYAHGDEELRAPVVPFKNTMCLWHKRGKCRKGEHCRFAHGPNQASEPAQVSEKGRRGIDMEERSARAGAGAGAAINFGKCIEPMKVESTAIYRHAHEVPNVGMESSHPQMRWLPPGLSAPQSKARTGLDAKYGATDGLHMNSKTPTMDWEGNHLYEDIKYIQDQIANLSMALEATATARSRIEGSGNSTVPPAFDARRRVAPTAFPAHEQSFSKPSMLQQDFTCERG
mmetsp:Transcript_13758/g.30279  ORF Transcript_13758/g.30279 Transcript_13758/m.30279 type:complete len:311 (-) Transcript_13758:351-1283(-)